MKLSLKKNLNSYTYNNISQRKQYLHRMYLLMLVNGKFYMY